MSKKIILFILIIFLFLSGINFVLAVDTYLPGPKLIDAPDIRIKIPGLTDLGQMKIAECSYDKTKTCYQIPWIAQYIGGVYKFGVSVLAILSVVVIAWGGIVWLTAGGSATQVTKAKDHILGGITGLILGLTSYVFLVTINPDFVNLKPIEVAWIRPEESSNSEGWTSGPSTGTYSDANARQIIRMVSGNKITINYSEPRTSLTGIRKETLDGLFKIWEGCSKCQILITAGTEGGYHKVGEFSHGSGYKLDLSYYNSSSALDDYIKGQIGEVKVDYNTTYKGRDGTQYRLEPDGGLHWDICFNCP